MTETVTQVDRLKELEENQRQLRLEAKQLRDDIKAKAEAEKQAKLDAMTDEEKEVMNVTRSINYVLNAVKKMDYKKASELMESLKKQINKAAAAQKEAAEAKASQGQTCWTDRQGGNFDPPSLSILNAQKQSLTWAVIDFGY